MDADFRGDEFLNQIVNKMILRKRCQNRVYDWLCLTTASYDGGPSEKCVGGCGGEAGTVPGMSTNLDAGRDGAAQGYELHQRPKKIQI